MFTSLTRKVMSYKMIIVSLFACVLVTVILVFIPRYQPRLRVVIDHHYQPSRSISTTNGNTVNIVMVYTGRWHFLQILLPYLHRDLRVNGGVIDEVWFMIIECDLNTMKRLTNFTETANNILKKNAFAIRLNNDSTVHNLLFPYSYILPGITSDPNINFFKLDDDIVYIHPEAFSNVLQAPNDPKCLLYFFNIAGSHWMLNWIYQTELSLYKDPQLNPKNLTFGYDPHAKCGWISRECNEMGLRTFLHHYKKSSLNKLLFNRTKYLSDKKQFSINAMLFNHKMLDLSALAKTKPITHHDEPYWTVEYTQNSQRENCIVGNALVVHFSYHKTEEYLLEKTNLLQDFQKIVSHSREQFKMDQAVWKLLEL